MGRSLVARGFIPWRGWVRLRSVELTVGLFGHATEEVQVFCNRIMNVRAVHGIMTDSGKLYQAHMA